MAEGRGDERSGHSADVSTQPPVRTASSSSNAFGKASQHLERRLKSARSVDRTRHAALCAPGHWIAFQQAPSG